MCIRDSIYNAPVINVTHVYTGADGLSHAEPQHEEADTSTYLGATLREFQLGEPSNVVLMTGPPNFSYPKHPAPYREIFLVLAGSMELELSDGTKHLQEPGSLTVSYTHLDVYKRQAARRPSMICPLA